MLIRNATFFAKKKNLFFFHLSKSLAQKKTPFKRTKQSMKQWLCGMTISLKLLFEMFAVGVNYRSKRHKNTIYVCMLLLFFFSLENDKSFGLYVFYDVKMSDVMPFNELYKQCKWMKCYEQMFGTKLFSH